MSTRFVRFTAMSLTFALMAACQPKDKDAVVDTDTDSSTDSTSTTCYPKVNTDALGGGFPTDGATDVFANTAIAVSLTGEASATSVTFTLNEGDGTGAETALDPAVFYASGTGDAAAVVATFQAAEPLKPSTEYTLTVNVDCAGTPTPTTIGFTTSAVGTAVPDLTALAGNAYQLDLSQATIVLPPGVGSLLGGLLTDLDDPIYIVLESIDDTTTPATLSLYGGIGIANEDGSISQDVCSETFNFDPTATGAAVTFNNPFFTIDAPDGITLNVQGMSITLESVLLSGAFSEDGVSLAGVRLAGDADARVLAPALKDVLSGAGTPDGLCSLLNTVGASCAPCADKEPYCIHLDALNLSGALLDGTDAWAPVTAADVTGNADCVDDTAAPS